LIFYRGARKHLSGKAKCGIKLPGGIKEQKPHACGDCQYQNITDPVKKPVITGYIKPR
jgi:hypothetical protein